MEQPQIHIPKPCPVALSRMGKTAEGYHCKSCQHEVIDFRKTSADEIRKNLKPGCCGIFNQDQLTNQPKLKSSRRLLFYTLTLLSLLGVQVNPISAQTAPAKNPTYKMLDKTGQYCPRPDLIDSAQVAVTPEKPKKAPIRLFRKKRPKKRMHLTGCPVF